MIGCLIVYDLSMTRVTGISPSGENERGLMFIGRCNLFLPLGKVRMDLRTRGGLMLIGRVTCSFPWGRLGWI